MSDTRPVIHTLVAPAGDHTEGPSRDQNTLNVPRADGIEGSRAHMTSSDGNRYYGNRRPSMQNNDATERDVQYDPGWRLSETNSNSNARQIPRDSETYAETTRQSDHGQGHSRREHDQGQGHYRQSDRRHGGTQGGSHRHSAGRRGRDNFASVPMSARSRSTRMSAEEYEEKDDRYVVPALPMPVAIICCVLNFIVPGLGSMAASVCVFCCAKTDDMTCREKCGSCCTVFGIGLLQLLLVACFLIGWVWSCIWGITFIGMSATYYSTDEEFITERQSASADRHRRQRGRSPLPTPQVVVNQPYPGINYEDLMREQERRRNERREANRRARSRISLSPSNLIYPMRAPSNIAYNSPPPPYQERAQPLPYLQGQGRDNRHANRQGHRITGETIHEEYNRR